VTAVVFSAGTTEMAGLCDGGKTCFGMSTTELGGVRRVVCAVGVVVVVVVVVVADTGGSEEMAKDVEGLTSTILAISKSTSAKLLSQA